MSPSSITNPSALLNAVGTKALSAVSAFGSGNFTGLLLQALQSGNATAAKGSAAATAGSASAASAIPGPHHGHHGGGSISAQQLLSMLQQINGAGAGRVSAPATLAPMATATPATGAASVTNATAPVTLQALLQNLQTGSAASRGIGRLLNTQA